MITVVVHRDGRHHCTLVNCPRADAERWAEEGFHVFQLIARGSDWAVNHVNSGAVFSNRTPPNAPTEGEVVAAEFVLPPPKGG